MRSIWPLRDVVPERVVERELLLDAFWGSPPTPKARRRVWSTAVEEPCVVVRRVAELDVEGSVDERSSKSKSDLMWDECQARESRERVS